MDEIGEGFEIVARPDRNFCRRGGRGGRIALFDEVAKTIDTGDAIRVKWTENRGKFVESVRQALRRRGLDLDWSRHGVEYVDLWAVPKTVPSQRTLR